MARLVLPSLVVLSLLLASASAVRLRIRDDNDDQPILAFALEDPESSEAAPSMRFREGLPVAPEYGTAVQSGQGSESTNPATMQAGGNTPPPQNVGQRTQVQMPTQANIVNEGSQAAGSEGGAIQAAPLASEATDSNGQTAAQAPSACQGDSCSFRPARIVNRLSPNARPFAVNAAEDARAEMEDVDDQGDDILRQLYSKLGDLKQQMLTEREWISRVNNIVEHYRLAVGRVEVNLRHEGGLIFRLKEAIKQRHKIIEREKLTAKLKTVNTMVDRLEHSTERVESNAQGLANAKANIQDTITSLQTAINQLQRTS